VNFWAHRRSGPPGSTLEDATKGDDTQKELEKRRVRDGRLLLRGLSKAAVARETGVSVTSVMRWAERVEAGGLQALKTQRRRGRPAGLDAAQCRIPICKLKAGAIAQGYPTELWTLPRVGQLIESEFGRRYSDVQGWRTLKSMNCSCQRLTGRAVQRDERAIRESTNKRWPALRETPGKQGKPSSSSTNRD
jgi:transposase